MLSISEITSKARAAPRPSEDVEVIFDAGISNELQRVTDQINDVQVETERLQEQADAIKPDLRLGDARPAQLAAEIAGANSRVEELEQRAAALRVTAAESLVTLRITALDQADWASLIAQSVPRRGVLEDANGGYNMDEVCRVAARRGGGVRVHDGETIDLSDEDWAGIWSTAATTSLQRLKAVTWYVNEGIWNQRIAEAKKGSPVTTAGSQTSPSPSESLPDASPDGNPPSTPTTSTTTPAV